MGAHPKNVLKITGLPKLVELVIIFIVLMILRFGGTGSRMLYIGDLDAEAFGHMVVFGYFFITFVQLVGVVLGEEINMQNLIYSFVGAILWFALGSLIIENTSSGDRYPDTDPNPIGTTQAKVPHYDNRMAMGAFSIIAGFVFLGDLVACVMYLKKERY